MKIKHFVGYGCVNAKKIKCDDNELIVRVWGEHEWGLILDDKMDVFDWLVKRFDKKRKDWIEIKNFSVDFDDEFLNTVIYTITFN